MEINHLNKDLPAEHLIVKTTELSHESIGVETMAPKNTERASLRRMKAESGLQVQLQAEAVANNESFSNRTSTLDDRDEKPLSEVEIDESFPDDEPLPEMGSVAANYFGFANMIRVPEVLAVAKEFPQEGVAYSYRYKGYGSSIKNVSMKVPEEMIVPLFEALAAFIAKNYPDSPPLEWDAALNSKGWNMVPNFAGIVGAGVGDAYAGTNEGLIQYKIKGIAVSPAKGIDYYNQTQVKNWALIVESPQLNDIRASMGLNKVDHFYYIIGHQTHNNVSPNW